MNRFRLIILSKKSFDSAKLVHSASLSSNKIATANASHFVYTTLAEQTITRITKLLLIMDKIISKNGIDYLIWNDENGDTWKARFDEVELFGKEVFENYPEPEDNLGSWSVTYNEEYVDYEPEGFYV